MRRSRWVWVLALATACSQGAGPLPAEPPADGGAAATDGGAPLDPCAASDRDGDGFGTHPSCPELDCDDTNPLIHPGAPEACNGLDDDCDGAIDEELGEGSCGLGACHRSVPFCVDGRPTACTPGVPSPEVCNGRDDDCNGIVDDGVAGDPCGVGACRRHAACVNGVMQACVPGAPVPETCNRIDDDCNGIVDDGFRAEVVVGSYLLLSRAHEGCDGAGQRIGPDCNAAMHRACAAQGCTTSGFGPVENSGDVAVYTCVAVEASITVSFQVLESHHGGCDGRSQRIGPECNAAIHRFCGAAGFATGFGPVESGASEVTVTCLPREIARVIPTTYTELAARHGGCHGGVIGARIGPDCNAAIHRFCAQSGATSGFGPVENSGDVAVVACVSP